MVRMLQAVARLRQGLSWSRQSLLALCRDMVFLVSQHGFQFEAMENVTTWRFFVATGLVLAGDF